MNKLHFGTGGSPHSSASHSSVDGVKRIAELGLDCMEVEFVYGVNVTDTVARQIGTVAANHNIRLSVHAPYYINLNAREPEKIKASQARLFQSARAASLLGARDVAFHSAFNMGDPPEQVYETVKKGLVEVLEQMERSNIKVRLRPELMGKVSQFGALNEVLRLAGELPGVTPCIDFAHWHARTGAFNSYDEFATMLSQIKERVGEAALKEMHIHVAGITYSAKGELAHRNLRESDFAYRELLQAFKDFKVAGLVICESPNLEEDALLLKRGYVELK
ncbi:MAG: TIM barrel protein [Dehalococcoidia bacterium]|nr:TIM barrel protein [Dehalococcoidia bacterium]